MENTQEKRFDTKFCATDTPFHGESKKKFAFFPATLTASFWLSKFEKSEKSKILEIRRPKTSG